MLTSSARKKSGIKYPNSYASAEQAEKDPKAFAFNCGMPPVVLFIMCSVWLCCCVALLL